MSPAQLGIVCFRRRFAGAGDKEWQSARLNPRSRGALSRAAWDLVSSTSLDGRYAIRLCILNHTTTEAACSAQSSGSRVRRWPSPPESAAIALSIEDRAPSVVDGLTGGGAFTVEELAAIPLFAGLPPEEVARAARWSREQCVGAGETVVERWDAARDFYVIVDGEARSSLTTSTCANSSPATSSARWLALDWDRASDMCGPRPSSRPLDLRLLALDPAHLGVLVRAPARFGEKLRAAARERLRQI